MKYLKRGKVWPHIYTLFFVVLGWGIFTANQPGAPLGLLLQKLFVPQGGIAPLYYLRNYGVLLALGCVCSSTLPSWLWAKISKNTAAKLIVFEMCIRDSCTPAVKIYSTSTAFMTVLKLFSGQKSRSIPANAEITQHPSAK